MFQRSSDAPEPPPPPLSDEQTMAQVVEPARHIVRAAGLRDVTGGFMFESCNDQGEPPYRGRVEMSFAMPDGVEPDAYFNQIVVTMVGEGWTEGPPPGKCPVGVAIHTETVMAIISSASGARTRGLIHVCGQCRNITDHCIDGATIGTAITDRLRQG
jgi:hypothetical protein